MDVIRGLVLFFSVIFLVSCAENSEKTPEGVFEKPQLASNPCQSETLENKFIVSWEDGTLTTESGTSELDFKKSFVEPQLNRIKKVYYDRKLQFYSQDELSSFSVNPESVPISDLTWGQRMIDAQGVWDMNFKGQGITVGIVDSYVDTEHPQLQKQILINSLELPGNNIDDDGNGVVDDYDSANFTNQSTYTIKNEHGTHVAGIVASDHSGNMKGIAPEAKLVAAPFISNDGSGSLGDAINAMNYVVKRGAKIINASWGGSVCVETLKDAFEEISNQGVLIVVAAGNEGRDLDNRPTYPAAFSITSQITVGASNINDYMSSFSNSSFNLVHMAAPGDYIYSTTPGGNYNFLKGTSMAAPFVSGAAATLWSAFPNVSAEKIKEALVKSVDVVANHEYRVISRGRLNLTRAYYYLNR